MGEFLRKTLGIGSFEMECDRLKDDNDFLTKELETQKEMNIVLADKIIKLENEVEMLKEDPCRIIEEEIIKHTAELEAKYEDELNHRSYNAGRQDAYREMGTESAKERWEKKKAELGIGVEDITADLVDVLGDDEITIDDLIELGV